MRNILKRIEIMERELGGTCVIPEKERIVVISYPDGDIQERERLKEESITKLKEKYGPNIAEDDLLVVGIRKFCRKHLSSDDVS